jgi:hypothetical protein
VTIAPLTRRRARFNPGWNRPPFEPPTAGSLRRNGAKPKSVRIGGTPPSHPRQCAGCPQGANHPATAAIRSSGSGPDPHRLRSFLRRRSAGPKRDFWSRFILFRPFKSLWQKTSGAVITSTPRGRAIFSRACLSESKDNSYNCCAPIRMFFRRSGRETPSH